MDTELDILETVTTVPLAQSATGVLTFWEAVLAEQSRVKAPSVAVARRTDPLWAVVLVILGALLSVGAGAFLITVGLGR